jgi:hypothetical protein
VNQGTIILDETKTTHDKRILRNYYRKGRWNLAAGFWNLLVVLMVLRSAVVPLRSSGADA